MFTSKQHLHRNLGVDADIAAFFVDRKVPVNNLYWKDRLLYVSKGSGYLFIPLYFDLQYKCGVTKDALLHEDYVQVMERLLHSAAAYEYEQIDYRENINICTSIVAGTVKSPSYYNRLLDYLNDESLTPANGFGTSSKALNRADTFLFLLCCLEVPDSTMKKLLEEWYALVPSFLIMDDLADLKEDRQKNQENCINDFGTGSTGVEKALDFLRGNIRKLKDTNIQLGNYLARALEMEMQTPYMQFVLNEYSR